MGERVRIHEVGPRDGLQNEATPIPTEAKARYAALLAAAGLREIELTSFVSARAIPQLADAGALLAGLDRASNCLLYTSPSPRDRG
jgi:hydroxymethylglutaryl-CoA lyase